MLDFEARCIRVKDDKWIWNVRIYRHGHLKEDFWLKDDYEMEALANAIDAAMVPYKKEEDEEWAISFVKKLGVAVAKNLSLDELRIAAEEKGYKLVNKE